MNNTSAACSFRSRLPVSFRFLLFVFAVLSLPTASLLLADGLLGLLGEIGQDVILELGLDLLAAPQRGKDQHHVFTDSRAVHPSNTL